MDVAEREPRCLRHRVLDQLGPHWNARHTHPRLVEVGLAVALGEDRHGAWIEIDWDAECFGDGIGGDVIVSGADAARRELLSSLDTIEGISLNGAVEAAKLTRVAYDVFVSPVVKISSQITGDVLSGMLTAFKAGRDWLGRINQDNATLAAIQTVLESWVKQVQQLPKQLDTITQADLDGAQAYLRSLQRKIDEEKAKLNSPQAQGTPMPKANPTPQATPKKK